MKKILYVAACAGALSASAIYYKTTQTGGSGETAYLSDRYLDYLIEHSSKAEDRQRLLSEKVYRSYVPSWLDGRWRFQK